MREAVIAVSVAFFGIAAVSHDSHPTIKAAAMVGYAAVMADAEQAPPDVSPPTPSKETPTPPHTPEREDAKPGVKPEVNPEVKPAQKPAEKKPAKPEQTTAPHQFEWHTDRNGKMIWRETWNSGNCAGGNCTRTYRIFRRR